VVAAAISLMAKAGAGAYGPRVLSEHRGTAGGVSHPGEASEPKDILSAGPNVELEKHQHLGKGRSTRRFMVPTGGYIYPASI